MVMSTGRVQDYERRFVLWFALGCAFLSILPNLYALIAAPPGTAYVGTEWATDDYMVYAAWTRQAMDGSFLFDNRFTTEPQPGLTINLYFFVLGQVARLTGVSAAFAIAKFLFSGLFVLLLHRLLRRVTQDTYTVKLALTFSVFGAGMGFLVWRKFGEVVGAGSPDFIRSFTGDRLPTDVWQPEGFTFPSMLTTSLFMVSLCLIILIFDTFLKVRESDWKTVGLGAGEMLLLMNIHSYDVLLIALVMVGFLVMSVVRGHATSSWLGRALLIGAGAVPAAIWFIHVLRSDPVFQERAATPTYSASFRQIFLGYLPLLGLAFAGLGGRRRLGFAVLACLVAAMVAFGTPSDGFWLGPAAWAGLFAVALVCLALLAEDDPAYNLIVSWAVIGLAAIYFPGLFQRKLTMGLAIPWGILAALGFARFASTQERGQRNLVSVLAILVICATSFFWLRRDLGYIHENVSRTAVHPVFLERRLFALIDEIHRQPGRKVVLAMPGIPAMDYTEGDPPQAIPDTQRTPLMPDLNPIVSGLAGAYTYAGHWSETPNYTEKRGRQAKFFLAATNDAERRAFLAETGATHILAPLPEAFPDLPLADLRSLGTIRGSSSRFQLIEVFR
jgi:hypothetical protein